MLLTAGFIFILTGFSMLLEYRKTEYRKTIELISGLVIFVLGILWLWFAFRL
jgi:hypothetical protein